MSIWLATADGYYWSVQKHNEMNRYIEKYTSLYET